MIAENLLTNLAIMVVGAAVVSVAVRGLRIPPLVAYLLTGLALGPVTGWVDATDALHAISETGIVLLLFLVGLELSLERVRGVGMLVLGSGVMQVLLTGAAGYLVAWAMGLGRMACIFLAVGLTFSSTVVVVKLLAERRQTITPFGQIAIGILLVQDLVVIVVMTVLTGVGGEAEGSGFLWVAGNLAQSFAGMAALVGAMVLIARHLLPRAFSWAARSTETLFVWSLCWCFLVVVAAELMHLPLESGAFLAGFSLAQLPYHAELRRRVHPLMNFFIAVFFVVLGVEMNLGEAAAAPGHILLLLGFVVIGKPSILFGILLYCGEGRRTAMASAILLAQISEFSFICVALGVERVGLDPGVLSVVSLVGLVSIAISSLLIIHLDTILDWLERSPRWKRLPEERVVAPMPSSGSGRRDHVIVVGINTLGRRIVERLASRGRCVLAIDTDPRKLQGLPCDTLFGNVASFETLEEARFHEARLVVSALRIEEVNYLVAYHCRRHGIPCSVHAFDVSLMDDLLALDVTYFMMPKVDGIKLQNRMLKELEVLP